MIVIERQLLRDDLVHSSRGFVSHDMYECVSHVMSESCPMT